MGSFTMAEEGRGRSGGLSVSLAGPDGRVVGGVVAGMLRAASPIQVKADWTLVPIYRCSPIIHQDRKQKYILLLVHTLLLATCKYSSM
jgi:hypothetical protein